MAISYASSLVPLLLLSIATATSAYSSSSDNPQTFIIHVSKSQKPSLFSSHQDWYTSILHSLPPSPHPTRLLYSYRRATHGFSAQLSDEQAAHLRNIPGVLSVIPDQLRHLHTTHTPSFLGLSSSSGLWQNSSYGDGVIIGVLDTGIWPEHQSFSDHDLPEIPTYWKGICEESPDFPSGSCNKKLIGARAYYRGYLASKGCSDIDEADALSPRDTEGHGTHTASTAAGSLVHNASLFQYASGEAGGMARKARIAAYKICWPGGCYDSDILAAMDQAITDGVHVISLSVGANGYAPRYDYDSIAIGAFSASQHGIVVSCSAGNSGPGPFTATNIAPWILTVGASTIDREFPADVLLGNNSTFGGVSLYSGDPLVDSKLSLVYAGDCGNRYCYTGSLHPSKVKGKIVVCDRGGNARVEKGAAVKLAGGAGMIMANTDENGEELIADSHLIPATMVGANAGDKIKEYIKTSQSPTATISFLGTVIGSSPSAPKVAAFSSRGPNHQTPEILKPDVIAPGVNILAAWTGASSPTDLNIDPRRVEFNIISGTSMSCPHVSGIAALLKKSYPDWSPAAIKSALVTTAYTLDNSGKKILDLANGKESTPFSHGAGHVDPNAAFDPGLVYDLNTSDYIAFLCAIGFNAEQIAVFMKKPASLDVCNGKLNSPGNLNYPSFSAVFEGANGVVKYTRVVKNVGKSGDAVYEVKVDAPANVEVKVWPTTLVFSAENQTLSYEITLSSVSLGWSGASAPSFGSIEWSDGIHRVRSPIAVKWRQEWSTKDSSI